ncbi:Pyridoxal-dependent decarboxylase conserved domain family protein [Leishmania donovani]|uniref:Pyridoxal-dependent decarboxylase conserved domain family protein n=2 Tax=Leishmania donovani TaxID=5661 RepID=A0A504X7B9_LEIDO|nr:Pyridoxal-dependent decarboxylase conserved domain family protein [Leishmania donovani]
MGRVPVANARLYRRLAGEARRLALLLEAAATALQNAADLSAPRSTISPASTCESAAPSPQDHSASVAAVWRESAAISNHQQHGFERTDAHTKRHLITAAASSSPASMEADTAFATVPDSDSATHITSSAAVCSATAESAVRRFCDWAEGVDRSSDIGGCASFSAVSTTSPLPTSVSLNWLHAWLASMAATVAVTSRDAAAVSAPVVQPVQAHHSLTGGAAMTRERTKLPTSTSGRLSEVDMTLANTVASCIGLPSRFHWPSASPRTSLLTGDTARGYSADHGGSHRPAHAALMLWPTAMRTNSGHIAPRPPTSLNSCGAAALTALPAVATAKEVFAKASTRAPTPSNTATDGGGALYSTTLEAYTVLLHTARTQAVTRGTDQHNAFASSESAKQHSSRLVLYCGDQCDALLVRAAQLLGIAYVRVTQTVAMKRDLPLPEAHSTGTAAAGDVSCSIYNYAVDVRELQSRLVEDVAAGLYPLMVVGTFGSGLSGSVDPLLVMGEFCQRFGVWFHIDASHGGTALLAGPAENVAPPARLQRDAILTQFYAAASLADSVLVPTGLSTAVPYAALPVSPASRFATAGSAALFFAHIRKAAWSVQALGEARQRTFNQWITPGVVESDVLHVSPPSHMEAWLFEQHVTGALAPMRSWCAKPRAYLQPVPAAPLALAERVSAHQQFVRAVLQAVRGDGRFDASLDAAAFGIVCLRWLTAADEATVRLARAWAEVLAEAHDTPTTLQGKHVASAPAHQSGSHRTPNAGGSSAIDVEGGGRTVPPVQVFVGLVQLQRRVWIHVSFGPLLDVPEDAPASLVAAGKGAASVTVQGEPVTFTRMRALTYVQHTLNRAASLARTGGAADRMPEE